MSEKSRNWCPFIPDIYYVYLIKVNVFSYALDRRWIVFALVRSARYRVVSTQHTYNIDLDTGCKLKAGTCAKNLL